MTQDDRRSEQSGDPAMGPVTRVRRAHKGIAGLLDDLDGSRSPDRNAEILSELGELLPRHFADEEAPDGLFDHLRARRPRIHEQLEALREEHRSILEILQALRAAKASTRDEASRMENLKGAFLRKLRGHERNENLLVMDVYFQDEGGPD
jgi:hemerythrin